MQYENRQPEEGINVSKGSPVKTFLQLLISTVLLLAVSVFVIYLSGSWLAKKIPFRYEQAIMEKIDFDFSGQASDDDIRRYLNDLSARIAVHLPNPDEVTYTVHYEPEDVFNAYATIGGNIVFYKGLINRLPNENALAMVMAHEMAHVSHRDPVAGLGGGVASMIALSAVFGSSGSQYASTFVDNAGGLTAVQFTRRMENNADDAAILAVSKLYGHTVGADSLFKHIDEEREESSTPDWLARFSSTHPLDSDRINNIKEKTLELELPTTGETTPLPDLW